MKNLRDYIKTESQLEKYAKKTFLDLGCLVYKFKSPSKRGVPDSIVITPCGETLYIEYKHPNKQGVISKLQVIEIAKMRANGVNVRIIDSVAQVNELAQAIYRGIINA
jgi:hypothetical protein